MFRICWAIVCGCSILSSFGSGKAALAGVPDSDSTKSADAAHNEKGAQGVERVPGSHAQAGHPELHLSDADASAIGKAIWRNECGGRVDGLTSWNAGEGFPSLGIGHFIWYREAAPERFEESFPSLVAFFQSNGIKLPAWLTPSTHCPWNSREEFLRDLNGSKLTELRALLVANVPMQTKFIVKRLESALPMVLEKVEPAERSKLEDRFYRVLKSGRTGTFALVDYVNFKGEGVSAKEQYKGEGWGLLQVLQSMADGGEPVEQFSKSAAAVLARRVQNAPVERHEERWLLGWKKRVGNYVHF